MSWACLIFPRGTLHLLDVRYTGLHWANSREDKCLSSIWSQFTAPDVYDEHIFLKKLKQYKLPTIDQFIHIVFPHDQSCQRQYKYMFSKKYVSAMGFINIDSNIFKMCQIIKKDALSGWVI